MMKPLRNNRLEIKTSKLVRVAILAATVLGFGNAAQAALVSCPASFTTNPTAKVEDATGLLTAANACQYTTPPDSSNVASIANINAAGFFGFSDWTLNTGNLQVDPSNDQNGTWAITAANFAANDYIIVFKDGSDTNLIAFRFNELFSNGVWSSPFADPPFDVPNTKDVSHYTIAQRGGTEPPCEVDCDPQELPEPGNVALFGIGILGAAAAMRRRRKQ
ncbi:PEP-CTERM sorting domain-containing protein [Massilia cavernae]|uniref:PEP-CTERM sorting domain-containing protein n=1 Tax=Massilia cavernae TaxID=2320864 RepID=A0A418XH58_9BURK|nr:PEP-CTERM sorting domain-containing protein [Massilia cavernae]RJG11803.1 PEP-CTERM sorting domain-containing protein [Massilia cavernae]